MLLFARTQHLLLMRRVAFVLAICFVALSFSSAKAQSTNKVYSGFIYHFTKYTQWPSEMQGGDFVIGVVESPEMFKELQNLAGTKTVGGRNIVVKQFSTGRIEQAHILFIAKSGTGQLSGMLEKAKANNTLVITESPGAATKGSVINFVENAGKVRFELNLNNAKAHNLKISGDLQKLAIIVG